jgi:hypothetical protein
MRAAGGVGAATYHESNTRMIPGRAWIACAIEPLPAAHMKKARHAAGANDVAGFDHAGRVDVAQPYRGVAHVPVFLA